MDAPEDLLEPEHVPQQSVPQQIRNRVINTTIGQWMRAIEMVLGEYLPSNCDIDEEAARVTKLALLMMLTRWYDEDTICFLLDSSQLKIPKSLRKTNRRALKHILDRPSDIGRLDDLGDQDEHPPLPDVPCPS